MNGPRVIDGLEYLPDCARERLDADVVERSFLAVCFHSITLAALGHGSAAATHVQMSGQGIAPADLGEAGEVGVGRADLQAVLDRQRGQISVWDQVAREPIPVDEVAKYLRVGRGRQGHPRG